MHSRNATLASAPPMPIRAAQKMMAVSSSCPSTRSLSLVRPCAVLLYDAWARRRPLATKPRRALRLIRRLVAVGVRGGLVDGPRGDYPQKIDAASVGAQHAKLQIADLSG